MPPFPTVPKCGCSVTRPHNNDTDKSAKAGLSAERGYASHTGNNQGHTHWDHVSCHTSHQCKLDRKWSRSKYTSVSRNPHSPFHEAVKNTNGCRLGHGKFWTGQTEDSIPQVCQLMEFKQANEWERYPNQTSIFMAMNETCLQEKWDKHH